MKEVKLYMLLSMSKLNGSDRSISVQQQTPEECIAGFEGLSRTELADYDVQPFMLYSDGLYMHSDKVASAQEEKISRQVARHAARFSKLSAGNENAYVGAAQALAWHQALLEATPEKWESQCNKILTLYNKDQDFANAVRADTLAAKKGNVPNEADIRFILDELVMFDQLRQSNRNATIIAYPGPLLQSDLYLQGKYKSRKRGVWADITDPDNIEFHGDMVSLPVPTPKSTKVLPFAFNKRSAGIGALAASMLFGAFMGVTNILPPSSEDSANDSAVSFQFNTQGQPVAATLDEKSRTTYFPDLENLNDQLVVENGQVNPVDTRDEGYLAYERGKAVRAVLEIRAL
ncbi:MAG: hypothetical protein IAE63_03075 [Alphaproteobacteria bacterium]|nr:hypothetical protein [Alphaproteobacteria bacterium]